MYIAQTLKDRIKKQCKEKKVTIKTMLTECDLSINAISQINDNGGMYSFNLARIADYLDCSVDYLLGRTDNPNAHKRTPPAVRKLLDVPEGDGDLITVPMAAHSSTYTPIADETYADKRAGEFANAPDVDTEF